MSFNLKSIEDSLNEIENTSNSVKLPVKKILDYTVIFDDDIEDIHNNIIKVSNENIVILKDKDVVSWLLDDTDFLFDKIKKLKNFDEINKNKTKLRKLLKKEEDIWGLSLLKKYKSNIYSDNKKNWTNTIGELIGKELMILLNKNPIKPKKIKNLTKNQPGYCLDLEVDDFVIECKISTFFTDGTANEKVLGAPFKYCEVPNILNKKLKILCMANSEKYLKDKFGIFTENLSSDKSKVIDFFKSLNIEFIAASEILKNL
jgi:hypothetical protein